MSKKIVFDIIDVIEPCTLFSQDEINIARGCMSHTNLNKRVFPELKGFFECKYCGCILDLFHTTCPQCGAPLTKGDIYGN